MTKTNKQTHYIYGGLTQDGCSVDAYDTQEEAKAACIKSMERMKQGGWNVPNQAIIRVDRVKTFDDRAVICEQITKTTVEIVDKDVIN